MLKNNRRKTSVILLLVSFKRVLRLQRILVLLFLSLILPLEIMHSQEALKPGEILSLDQCIAVALKRHPALHSAEGGLKASQSRVNEAKSSYYPQISASSAINRDHSADLPKKPGATYNQYQTAVDLNQTLLDFGKTSTQVKMQSQNYQASQFDLQDVIRLVIFNVKQAYYGIFQSNQNRDAFAEEVKQFQLHLDQAKKFYEVGLKAKIDITTAEVNLGQAKLNLLSAENTIRLARIALNNAMGLSDAFSFDIQEPPGFQDYPITLEAALDRGYANRPDLQSAMAKSEAVKSTVDLAYKNYYPVLSGNAEYGWMGQDSPLKPEWSVGAVIRIPLFSGHLTQYQIQEARANVETAQANEELIKQNVRFDIEQAFYNLQNVRERISLAELTLKQAQENRELAQGRYSSGVGSSIEVADAVLSEINAKTAQIAAVNDYRLAIASLEKAMGENR